MAESVVPPKVDQTVNLHVDDEPDELPKLPMPVRINLAYNAWLIYGNNISVRKIA